MPGKGVQKSKQAKALAAASASRGKGKKKKWSKGKVREKKNNDVIFDGAGYEKMLSAIPKQKLITVATVSERLHVTGSLARKAIRKLAEQGDIICVVKSRSQLVYTRPVKEE